MLKIVIIKIYNYQYIVIVHVLFKNKHVSVSVCKDKSIYVLIKHLIINQSLQLKYSTDNIPQHLKLVLEYYIVKLYWMSTMSEFISTEQILCKEGPSDVF